jgi:hypothetical protein
VHAEQLVLVGDSQLKGAYRVGAGDEVDDNVEVGRAVSQRAGDEGEVLAALAILLLFDQERRFILGTSCPGPRQSQKSRRPCRCQGRSCRHGAQPFQPRSQGL